jgi:hypothetical protein
MLAGHQVEVAVLVDVSHGASLDVILVQELSLELRVRSTLNEREKPKEREKEKQGSKAMHRCGDWRFSASRTKGKQVIKNNLIRTGHPKKS